MRLKANMIYINLLPKIDPGTKGFFVDRIEILDQEYYKDGMVLGEDDKEFWYTYTHFRGQGKFKKMGYYQLGFEIIDLEEDEKNQEYDLFISANHGSSSYKLKYYKEKNIYFDLAQGKVKKGKIEYSKSAEKMSVGITTAGIFDVNIFDSNNINVYTSPPIYVLPSSISYQDYKAMIDDLLKIKDDLIIDEKAKAGFEGNWSYRMSSVAECLDRIRGPLKRIDRSPAISLTTEFNKKSFKSNKNTKARTLIERELMPFKGKYNVQTYKEETDIYENRMIKYALNRLKNKIENYSNTYEIEADKRDQEMDQIQKGIEDKYGKKIEIRLEELEKKIIENQKQIDMYKKNYIEQIENIYQRQKELGAGIDVYFDIYKELDIDNKIINSKIQNGKLLLEVKALKNKNEEKYLSLEQGNYKYLEYDKFQDARFYANVFTIKIETRNLDQTIFFLESILNASKNFGQNKIRIYGRAIKNSGALDDPLGGDFIKDYKFRNGRRVKNCDIKMTEIYTINDEKVPDYPLDYISEKLLSYVEGDRLKSLEIGIDTLNEEKMLLSSIITRKSIHRESRMDFLNQDRNWEYIISQIDCFLSLDIFKNVKNIHPTWKPTQIFTRDSNYNVLYKNLKSLDYKIDYISEFNSRKFAVKVTHDIYENWCFFKMIQVLVNEQRWDLENHGDLLNWIASNRDSEGIKAVLSHDISDDSKIKLTIYNNKKVYYTNREEPEKQRYKKPDYTLVFSYNGTESIVYLDAKYRNYKEQKREMWLEDIKKVSIDTYIKTFRNAFEGKENEPISSFIVHSDIGEEWNFFGGDLENCLDEKLGWENEAVNHRFGSFSFLPSKTTNFRTFFKMVLEYHLGLYFCCWNCGQTLQGDKKIDKQTKKTERGHEKYHYTCNNCGEFWVKNHCLQDTNHPLIKHLNNYHSVDNNKNNPWYVICPSCNYNEKYEEENNTWSYDEIPF